MHSRVLALGVKTMGASHLSCPVPEEKRACCARGLPSDGHLDPGGRVDPGCVCLGSCSAAVMSWGCGLYSV